MYKLQKLFIKALRSKDHYVLRSGTDSGEIYRILFQRSNVLAFPRDEGEKETNENTLYS